LMSKYDVDKVYIDGANPSFYQIVKAANRWRSRLWMITGAKRWK
jgi:hypothetical protein